jgi:hypothetical protein
MKRRKNKVIIMMKKEKVIVKEIKVVNEKDKIMDMVDIRKK